MKEILVTKQECKVCGYSWIPIVKIPKTCAKCKSHNWNRMESKNAKPSPC